MARTPMGSPGPSRGYETGSVLRSQPHVSNRLLIRSAFRRQNPTGPDFAIHNQRFSPLLGALNHMQRLAVHSTGS